MNMTMKLMLIGLLCVSLIIGTVMAAPDISGTWEGDMSNPGQEDYSMDVVITQNGDQISGTSAFVITASNVYPQDVGKHYTYAFTGTIDETGNIHIIGDFAEGPAEILARAGHWDMNWQLSTDGNAISFHGVTDGTYLDMLLHRGTSNQPPVAEAGLHQTGTVGTLVTLDGTGSSDPDNNLPLTYAWTMSAPSGSTATLSSTTASQPTFTPDVAGDYNIALTVTDSLLLPSTTPDTVKITVTNQPPEIEILSATMVSPNELGIGVNVTFPKTTPKNAARRITFEATINGKPIKKTIDVTTYTKPGIPWGKAGTPNPTVDKKGNVLPTTLLRINLADENVPRFTENMNFDVIGYASYDGGPSSEKSITNTEVLLPVVLLRGWAFLGGETRKILFDNDVAYNGFIVALRTRGYYDNNNWESPNKKLPSYRTLWDPRDKETLYDDPLKTTPVETKTKMNLLLTKYVLPHSYADKVNIVGHSFGGLVGRYFASVDPRVNTVIMVGAPHQGLPLFYDGAFSFKNKDAMSKKIMPGSMAFWAAPTYPCLVLEDSTLVPNLFQNTIESIGQSPGVKYYSIYADTEKTDKYLIIRPTAKGKSTWYDVVDHAAVPQGDGLVPSTSASGFGTPIRIENNPYSGWPIPGFVHVNLMNIPEVKNDAIDLLTDTP